MSLQTLQQMKQLVGFEPEDAVRLIELKPLFEQHADAVIEQLHQWLTGFQDTRALIEGRETGLKAAHRRWLDEIFVGTYEQPYYDGRMNIGTIHVGLQVPPHFVDAMISHVRSASFRIILEASSSCEHATRAYGSLLKILDLDLLIINSAYREERLTRICRITGASRALIEKLIEHGDDKTSPALV